MNDRTTKAEWLRLRRALEFRREQLNHDLKHEDYSHIESVIYGKHDELNAIEILLMQVPFDIKSIPLKSRFSEVKK